MLFDQVVQAFSFEPILGDVLKPVVQWMVWQPLHLFSMGEKLCLSLRFELMRPTHVTHVSKNRTV